ncbi:hypothetical protein [Xylophilus rhododendri]|nr:hypothetical protein [Xylophilus rhododendri]
MHFGTNGPDPAPQEKSRSWLDWLSDGFDVVELIVEVMKLF